MISEAYTGSATIGNAEYSLPNDDTSLTPIVSTGIFQVFIDITDLEDGDQYLFSIYETVLNGGSKRLISETEISGMRRENVFVSPPLQLMYGWDMTLQKLIGVDRDFSWSIRAVT